MPTAPAMPFAAQGRLLDEQVTFVTAVADGHVFVTRNGDVLYALGGLDPLVLRAKFDNTASAPALLGGNPASAEGDSGHLRILLAPAGPNGGRIIDLGERYPGITVRLVARDANVEQVFLVAPGADPAAIAVQLDGAQNLAVNPSGELSVVTNGGSVRFTAPVAYQMKDGHRDAVDVIYTVAGDTYGFAVGAYNPNVPLVIDPLLASTVFGDVGRESGWQIVMSPAGDIYVVGRTTSPIPTSAGAFDSDYNGGTGDLFVAQFDAQLTTLLAATYLGGSGSEAVSDIQIDAAGRLVIFGSTSSPDFPTTPTAFDNSYSGGTIWDCFVAVFEPDLSALAAATFFGEVRACSGIVVDAANNLVISGATRSADFPTTPGAFNETFNGGSADGFVAKLSPDLGQLLASTLFGGADGDGPEGGGNLALDVAGHVLVSGGTSSPTFPTTPDAYDNLRRGIRDGYILEFDADLTQVLAATLFGGSDYDSIYNLTMDATGNVYVYGYTYSLDLPMTPGAYDPTLVLWEAQPPVGCGPSWCPGIFLASFDPGLTTLRVSTYFGTRFAHDMVVAGDSLFLAGDSNTVSTPGSLLEDCIPGQTCFDGFLSRFSLDLTEVSASTRFGFIRGMAVDPAGNLLLTGSIFGDHRFPVTFGAYDEIPEPTVGGGSNGETDAFISVMTPDLAAPPCFHNGDVNGDGVASAADAQLAMNFTLQILYPPYPWEVCAVDCNGDGTMSAGDAQLIFWSALEMGQCVDALP